MTDWFFGSRKSLALALSLVFLLATGIRFYDLTDLPLDFAPTRQLFSALKARGIYYSALTADELGVTPSQRETAIRQWQAMQAIEPPIIENLTALTYRLTGEYLWIARIYSSIFWVAAGFFLFLLASELTGPDGAFIALLVYLFLPYGVIASRSFQPDPLMVALMLMALWATFRWANTRDLPAQSWKWVLLAGLFNGLAIFVKNVAVFPLALAALALVLEYGLWKSLKDRQTWVLAGLSILPAAIYSLYGLFIAGFLGQQFAFRFFPQLWTDPGFYLRWKGQIDGVTGFPIFALGLAGLFLARRRSLALLAGLWLGYFAYGLTFAYHISTHDYYQIPLIPIAAISLAPLAQALFAHARALRSPSTLTRAALGLSLLLVIALQIWTVRVDLAREDWRADAQFWATLGQKLGQNGPVLTISQDYGYRLAYWGWQQVDSWYDSGDLDLRALDGRQIDLVARFKEQAAGKRFLVVTQMNKLDQQPEIKDFVNQTCPILAQGQGYIVFDLAPLQPK